MTNCETCGKEKCDRTKPVEGICWANERCHGHPVTPSEKCADCGEDCVRWNSVMSKPCGKICHICEKRYCLERCNGNGAYPEHLETECHGHPAPDSEKECGKCGRKSDVVDMSRCPFCFPLREKIRQKFFYAGIDHFLKADAFEKEVDDYLAFVEELLHESRQRTLGEVEKAVRNAVGVSTRTPLDNKENVAHAALEAIKNITDSYDRPIPRTR